MTTLKPPSNYAGPAPTSTDGQAAQARVNGPDKARYLADLKAGNLGDVAADLTAMAKDQFEATPSMTLGEFQQMVGTFAQDGTNNVAPEQLQSLSTLFNGADGATLDQAAGLFDQAGKAAGYATANYRGPAPTSEAGLAAQARVNGADKAQLLAHLAAGDMTAVTHDLANMAQDQLAATPEMTFAQFTMMATTFAADGTAPVPAQQQKALLGLLGAVGDRLSVAQQSGSAVTSVARPVTLDMTGKAFADEAADGVGRDYSAGVTERT